jgi:hypothetical protein
MNTRRACILVASLALAASSARAQATSISAPDDDYLLRITQEWAAASPLGSLPAKAMAPDDVELRVWGGYGLTGTSGVILRRVSGRWQSWRARVVDCKLTVSIPIGDTASAATESLFVARAHKHCGSSIGDTQGAAHLYDADTLAVESAIASKPEETWQHVIAAGVLNLPPRVPRKWMMVDGFTYVIEVRRGDAYRASVIEALETAEVDADRVARIVYERVVRGVGPAAGERR